MNRIAARHHDCAAHVGPTRKSSVPFRRSLIPASVRFLLLALVTTPLTLFFPSPAVACTCDQATTAEYIQSADLVATGTIGDPDAPGPITGSQRVQYDVIIDDIYAGKRSAEIIAVISAASGAGCGWERIMPDTEYMLFLRRQKKGGYYRGNLCDGTTPATSALIAEVEDLTSSGPRNRQQFPREPKDAIPPPGDPDTPWALGSLGVVGVGLLGWQMYRRRTERITNLRDGHHP
jgi:hypothetical protein